ncbi:nuclear transport factor 2 family protein [Thalassotalea profundi]|uniref:Nuclear transport factor 2 family protein n=1 Tax=Thalassotalea profundi TaxID=2036687 RepID=A0ABQ3IXL5_9GAMM|nr:nuclear transport factor 2 family protein [Thalassotalea profundi]GHE97625.1 hypothetical protein GCM10011501_29060 [Thalassotalea profundi]
MKFIALLFVCFSFNVFAEKTLSGEISQTQSVEKAVNYYLDGSKLGDPDIVAKAFHETAKIQGVKDGALKTYELEQFLGFFSKDKPGTHITSIIAVDIENTAASVRAEWDMGTWKYVDYLSLLKFGDEWKIVNKIYTVVQK